MGQAAKKGEEQPAATVSVTRKREIVVTFSLSGVEQALVEAARQQAEDDSQDANGIGDPTSHEIELDLSADRDGDNVRLNGATITFLFSEG